MCFFAFVCSLEATGPFSGFESVAWTTLAWLTFAFPGEAHAIPIAAAATANMLRMLFLLAGAIVRPSGRTRIGHPLVEKKCHRVTIASTGEGVRHRP
jgi:hypothetical protein